MKKAMIALVSIALLVGLVGCGGQPAAEQQPASSAAPEPTYATHLNIKCDENLLFSKYDVEVLIDEETVGELDHGTEKTFEVNLEAGSHTLKVCNVDERGVDGSQEFSVSDETIVDCKIACTASQVEIHEFSAMTMAEKAEADKKAQEEADRKAAEEAEATAKEEEAKAKGEQEEAEEAKAKESAEESSGALTASKAWVHVSSYGEDVYPYGFKLHYLMGVLNEEQTPDGAWILKATCDVKNAYGTWMKDLVCEATVGGTENNPVVQSFVVY